MGFAKYKHSKWLTFHDLPTAGALGTIKDAEESLQENFRTKEMEMRITLHFQEWKSMTLTNPNLDTLQSCFPDLDHTTIGGQRLWLMPEEIEVGGDIKQIVRINQLQTLRMQPDPTQAGQQPPPPPPSTPTPSAGSGTRAGGPADDGAPAPGDDDNIPF